jgi:hypothetical protein
MNNKIIISSKIEAIKYVLFWDFARKIIHLATNLDIQASE